MSTRAGRAILKSRRLKGRTRLTVGRSRVPARTVGRITRRAAFAELQRSRARGASGPVRVTFVPAPAGDPGVYPQVAYAIGRHCGGAVVRNSLRRRVREVVRSSAPTL